MNRTLATGLFFVFLVLLGGSVVYLMRSQGSSPASPEVLVERADRIARRQAPPPPAPPSGHIEQRQVVESVQVPSPPHAIGHEPGQPEPRIVQHLVEKPRLVGASPQATAAWQAQSAQQQSDYERAFQEAIERLSASENSRSPDILSQIVAVVTAATGLIGAIATLITAVRGPAKAAK